MAQRQTASGRRYARRIWPTWAVYLITLFGSQWLLESAELTGLLRHLVAMSPAIPLIAVIFFVGQLMYGKEDDFQRALWVEAMLWGTAITLAATTIWGFLEITGAPSIRLYWVFPFFTGAALIIVPLLAKKYE